MDTIITEFKRLTLGPVKKNKQFTGLEGGVGGKMYMNNIGGVCIQKLVFLVSTEFCCWICLRRLFGEKEKLFVFI